MGRLTLMSSSNLRTTGELPSTGRACVLRCRLTLRWSVARCLHLLRRSRTSSVESRWEHCEPPPLRVIAGTPRLEESYPVLDTNSLPHSLPVVVTPLLLEKH